MPELRGVPLANHLDAIFAEFEQQRSMYGYPERKMYRGFPGLDLSVAVHGKKAATPLGPAAGPHTQMAQNILLAFLGGSRFMELKTVQVLDDLKIPRPCIDMRTVGYNVEWSQEMRMADSLREYVTAWMLLKIIEASEILSVPAGDPFYNTIFDVSVGYDLAGIQSTAVGNWLRTIRDATALIAEMQAALPERYSRYRALNIPPHIADTVTLSTFHGCPADEIEAIVRHLVSEHGFHVIVKMNPTLPGYDFVRETLNAQLGYRHIELDPAAFEHDLKFEQAVAMMRRLQQFAAKHNRHVGAKFTNTLVVKNSGTFFNETTQYLSGTPLHVLAMHTMHQFRDALGDDFPVSFSAGIDKDNFVDAVLCNLKPVTTCSDLLHKGGYTRQFNYLQNLKKAMEQADVTTIDGLIQHHGKSDDTATAGHRNSGRVVAALAVNPKYHAGANSTAPKKIGSQLELFDCISCNICLPVCPNGANFNYRTEALEISAERFVLRDGHWQKTGQTALGVAQKIQIATLAEFCNECGNCDTFCPEDGGPYLQKALFFLDRSEFDAHPARDAFYFSGRDSLHARIGGQSFQLSTAENGLLRFTSSGGSVPISVNGQPEPVKNFSGELDLLPYHIMRVVYESFRSEQQPAAQQILLMPVIAS